MKKIVGLIIAIIMVLNLTIPIVQATDLVEGVSSIGNSSTVGKSETVGLSSTVGVSINNNADASNGYDGTRGDVNNDQEITILDVVAILKDIVKLEQLTASNKALADVTADGDVSIVDVVDLLKYIVQLEESFTLLTKTQIYAVVKTNIMEVDESDKIDVKVVSPYTNNYSVKFSSSNTDVVKCSSDGVIVASKVGTANITITASDNTSIIVPIEVKSDNDITLVESIVFDPDSLTLEVGIKGKLPVKVLPETAIDKTLKWESLDSSVVSVNSYGVITTLKAGSTTIQATSSNGVKGQIKITVTSNETLIENGESYVIKLKDTDKALTVDGAGTANKTNVSVSNYTGAKNQIFTVSQNSNGTYYIIPNHASSKVVDVFRNYNPVAIGQNIDIWEQDPQDTQAQEWELDSLSDGSYIVKLAALSNGAMGVNGDNVLVVSLSSSNSNQKWEFTKFEEDTTSPDEPSPDIPSIDIPSGSVIEITAENAYTYPHDVKDNVPYPSDHPLPKGTLDVITDPMISFVLNGTTYNYYNLGCGLKVKADDLKLVNDKSLSQNIIKSVSVKYDDKYTYVTVDTPQKIPYTVDMSSKKFDINFKYTTSISNVQQTSAPNLTSISAKSNTLSLSFNRILGYKAYYNQQNQLVFRFLNPQTSLTNMTIVLDPGHGEGDPGAVRSLNGVQYYERDINRQVVSILSQQFKNAGANVYVISTDTKKTVIERLKEAEAIDPDIILSIHQNATSSTLVSGTESYYFNSFSARMSTRIASSISINSAFANRGGKYDYFYMTRSFQCPSALVECGFMSNTFELSKLLQPEYQAKISKGIVEGVYEYLLGY